MARILADFAGHGPDFAGLCPYFGLLRGMARIVTRPRILAHIFGMLVTYFLARIFRIFLFSDTYFWIGFQRDLSIIQ